ncbi:hypothetical protein SeLEV6574_g06185 [Synchytrium endobioticum]|uniref:XPG-I domain-containing protein n=1 Tax=Synchytrium endobioticum TaxID=286115 RepID=A0A507CQ46_9FUNG|nr:hypothetical protein SeLEV6574_g06185 [Synchytrium endobioticum]
MGWAPSYEEYAVESYTGIVVSHYHDEDEASLAPLVVLNMMRPVVVPFTSDDVTSPTELSPTEVEFRLEALELAWCIFMNRAGPEHLVYRIFYLKMRAQRNEFIAEACSRFLQQRQENHSIKGQSEEVEEHLKNDMEWDIDAAREALSGLQGRFLVDLLGSFFRVLKRDDSISHWSLISVLKELLPMDRTVVVLDGVAREAKFETSCKRRDISRHSLDKLDRAATKLEQAVAGGRYRMPHAFWQRIDRLKSSCNNVTMEDKQDLEKLLTKAGFEIIIAEGEADVYIGAHALAQGIIISADSDMAFYEGVQTLAMPKFTRGGYIFQLVKKQQVLERLGLEPFALPVLGIVSGNDYVPNVPGLAIRRNVELLKQLQTHQRTSKELLDAYVIATDADSLGYDFTSAYNVFLEFNEGHNVNVDVDDPMDRLDIIERIDRAREQMYITRHQRQP